MAVVDYWRQLDLISPSDLAFPITLIGAGGIGSPTALALAKMGCSRLTVYDPDVVEQHNLPNQFYRLADVGQPKVTALRGIVGEFADQELEAVQARFANDNSEGVVISAVDSMDDRRKIWTDQIRYRIAIDLYIDARMGAEVCRIYAVRPSDPDDVRFYESSLYSDQDAQDLACTAQSIIYNVLGVAALIANLVKKHARGQDSSREIIFDYSTLSLLQR